jgi:D-alanyl-D-alanine carboxypeptidase
MRSGIPDTADSSIAKLAADPGHAWTQPEIIAEFPAAESKPGTEYNYSNPTYKLLGFAVEHVTGQGLAEAMRERVLDPAGSSESLLVQSALAATPQPWSLPTSGVGLGTGGALPFLADATFSGAASGMAGTAPEVAKWAWQLFAGKIISSRSLATMLATTDSNGDGTGLDTFSTTPLSVGHTGSKEGYQSLLTIYPEKQEVIVVFVNQRDAQVDEITAKLAAALG